MKSVRRSKNDTGRGPGAARTTVAAVAVAAVVLAAGCRITPLTGVPAGASLVPEEQVEPLLEASYSGYEDRRRQVIRTPETWADAWRQLYEGRSPLPERPAVDFDRSMVILAAAGSRPTGGYGIEVESVHRDEETMYVVVRETSPGDDCMVTQAFTAPTTAVRVPRVDGSVEFVEKESVAECS